MPRTLDRIKSTPVPGDPQIGGPDLTYGKFATGQVPTFEGEGRRLEVQRAAELSGVEVEDHLRDPKGFGEKTLDFLLRGQYMGMKIIDTILDDDGYAFGEAFVNGARELVNPKERLSFKDILQEHATEFAEQNPKSTSVLGFIGDVALDPTTYLTFGSGAGARIGIKGASVTGKQIASKGGKGALSRIMSRRLTRASEDAISPKVFRALNKEGQAELAATAKGLMAGGDKLSQAGLKKRAEIAKDLITNKGFDKHSAIEYATNQVRHLDHIHQTGLKKGSKFARELGFVEKMTPQLAFETAERRVANAVNLLPELAEKYLDKGGVRLAGMTLAEGGAFTKIADAVGITRLKEVLKDSYVGTALRRSFTKSDLPVELKQLHKAQVTQVQNAERKVKTWLAATYGTMTKESREKVGTVLGKVDDETTRAVKAATVNFEKRQALKTSYLEGLPQGAVPDRKILARFDAPINVRPDAIRARVIQDAKLSPKEHSAVADFWQTMASLANTEQQAGLLGKLKLNYSPRYYELIKDAPGLSRIRQNLHRFNEQLQFGPGETRKFQSLEQAAKMGYAPITDAGVLFSLRVMEHHNALADKLFMESAAGIRQQIKTRMRKLSNKGLNPRRHKGNVDKLEHFDRYVKYVGEGLYNQFTEKEIGAALRGYDNVLGVFRTFATVARPAFGVRQLFSNHFQNFIGAGKNGIKHLYDPRSTFDAAAMMNGYMNHASLANVSIKSVFGTHYSGDDIMKLAFDLDIVRNISIDGVGHTPLWGERGARKYLKALDQKRKLTGALGESPAGKGMARMLAGVANYTHFPAAVEDFSRLSMFTNLLRSGHAPQRAAGMVDDAMFDYMHGLSLIEQRYVRRVIPFYSFQRFAVPLMTRAAVNAPGRVANAAKAGQTLMEMFGKFHEGEKLNDAERASIPGWLIEQPFTFAGWDQEMNARFKTFNNYSPLDVFSFMQATENGDVDIKASLLHASMAQLTPIIKVPLEWLEGRDFFTGRALDDARKMGDIDVDKLLGNLVGLAVGGSTGAGGLAVAGGGALGQVLSKLPVSVGKETLGRLLGMEEGIDKRTGKRTVYFNAYAVHTLTSMAPGLLEAFKISREDKTPLEKTQQFLFGIPTTKLDMGLQKQYKARSFAEGVRERQGDMRQAALTERFDALAESRQDLEQWVSDWQTELTIMQSGVVRGANPVNKTPMAGITPPTLGPQ